MIVHSKTLQAFTALSLIGLAWQAYGGGYISMNSAQKIWASPGPVASHVPRTRQLSLLILPA